MTVRISSLANGLRVVTERMPGFDSATVGLWVTAGNRHERAEQNGIAHFLEHMAFKGTRRRTARQIAEAIEDVGGYLNAYTSREMTAYYARVLARDVPLALDLIADIVLEPVFDPAEIETERHVILQEIGQALDTPDDIVFDWLQEVAFPDQPLGRPILGPAERVAAFGRDDLTAFVAEHYRPDRMILAAAGAVDHEAIVAAAGALFAAARPAPGGPVEPARWRGGERREVKDLEQVHFTLGLPAPAIREDAAHAAQVYATLLGGGMSSRLFQKLREDRGLCYAIYAQAGAFADAGLLTIYAGTSAEEIAALAELTVDELRRLPEEVGEAEVARARAQLRAGLLMGLESPSSRAERLARDVAVWGRVRPTAEILERIEAVGRVEVAAFAEGLVERQEAALAIYGPAAAAPELAALKRRLAG
ncbi:M16 family metallopeptidase [Albidovulum sp.]